MNTSQVIILGLAIVFVSFLFTLKFNKLNWSDNNWHNVINLLVIIFALGFGLCGILMMRLENYDTRIKVDPLIKWCGNIFYAQVPIALATVVTGILGWKKIDNDHKIRSFIPLGMYAVVFLIVILGNIISKNR